MLDRLWVLMLVAVTVAIVISPFVITPADDRVPAPNAHALVTRRTSPAVPVSVARHLDRVPASSMDRDATTTPAAPVAYLSPLKSMLAKTARSSRDPVRRYTALGYLGLLGETSHREQLLREVYGEPHPADALPAIANLITGFGDRTQLDVVRRIADGGRKNGFAAVWALELLACANDRTRLPLVRAMARSRQNPVARRLRALELLADMGDVKLRGEARAIGRDLRVPFALRMHGLACVVRIDAAHRTGQGPHPDALSAGHELRAALAERTLSLSERLTLTHQLAIARDESVVPFLHRVVERDAVTVLDQVRALNLLALLGRRTHVRTLRRIAGLRPRARHAAARALAVMGDRSQTAKLVDECLRGDLDAARTLVLTRLLDRRITAPARLLQDLRHRSLVDS